MKSRIRLVVPLLLALLALSMFASSALAFDCIVVSRSDAGDLNASHSGNWAYFSMADIFSNMDRYFGVTALNATQAQWATEEAARQGLPNDVTIFTRGVLLEGTAADTPSLMSNGKGIDHLDQIDLFPKIFAIYSAALTR